MRNQLNIGMNYTSWFLPETRGYKSAAARQVFWLVPVYHAFPVMSPVAKNVINSSLEREDLQQQVLSRIYTGFPFHRFGRLNNSKYEPCGCKDTIIIFHASLLPCLFYQEQKIKDFFKLAHYEQADEKEKSLPSVPSYLSDKTGWLIKKRRNFYFHKSGLISKPSIFNHFSLDYKNMQATANKRNYIYDILS